MYNKTTANLMLQTIMILMPKQNNTDVTIPGNFNEDREVERCYGNFGCFSTEGFPWTENRPYNYFPLSPETMLIRYPTFTRRNRKTPVFLVADNKDRIRNANIDPRGPFYFISHGFLEGGTKPWIQEMTNALLNLEGNDHATVMVVDWIGGSQPPYGQAVANIRLIGVMTAHLIHDLYEVLGLSNTDNFHFIGHSLGAHLAGYCGHALHTKFRLRLGRITGLDPAAPHFSRTVTMVRLDRTDAKFVDIIHSNAIPLYMSGLGISEAIGHLDFYPNGGSVQPGCSDKSMASLAGDLTPAVMKMLSCHHVRSHEFFTESIAPSCPFIGMQCESYEAFLAGNCTTCDLKKHLCIPMGYHSHAAYRSLQAAGIVDPHSHVSLYSKTGSRKPFCRVHYEVTLKVSNSTESRARGPESGKVSIMLIDKNHNKSEHKFLDDEQKYYKPGDIEKRMVAIKDKGYPPLYAVVEWKYETKLFNPMTWRLLKSPSIYIEYLKLSSLEYNTDITVCPQMNKPVVANMPTILETKYCKFNK